jgi:DNA polymerase-3 subunit delta'
LLKVLEEPPARSLFLMVSHAPGRLLPTIRSRARRLDLQPLPIGTLIAALTQSERGTQAAADDLKLAAELADGSLRRGIQLLEGSGIDLYRAFSRLVAQLPDVEIAAMHAFADAVSGYRDDTQWTTFRDLLSGWLNRRVRGEGEPDGQALPAAARTASLERWAEVWEKMTVLSEDTDEYNLDRKRTVLSILMAIARATRM